MEKNTHPARESLTSGKENNPPWNASDALVTKVVRKLNTRQKAFLVGTIGYIETSNCHSEEEFDEKINAFFSQNFSGITRKTLRYQKSSWKMQRADDQKTWAQNSYEELLNQNTLAIAKNQVFQYREKYYYVHDTEKWSIIEELSPIGDDNTKLKQAKKILCDYSIFPRIYEEKHKIHGTYTDKLTGAKNVAFLNWAKAKYFSEDTREDDVERAKKYNILWIDVWNFKYYNDNYWYGTGDRILEEISTLLLDCIRNTDHVIRKWWDEFMILQEVGQNKNSNYRANGNTLKKRILDALQEKWITEKVWGEYNIKNWSQGKQTWSIPKLFYITLDIGIWAYHPWADFTKMARKAEKDMKKEKSLRWTLKRTEQTVQETCKRVAQVLNNNNNNKKEAKEAKKFLEKISAHISDVLAQKQENKRERTKRRGKARINNTKWVWT